MGPTAYPVIEIQQSQYLAGFFQGVPVQKLTSLRAIATILLNQNDSNIN